jgi:hypothetical protein
MCILPLQVVDAIAVLAHGCGLQKHSPMVLPLLSFVGKSVGVADHELHSMLAAKGLQSLIHALGSAATPAQAPSMMNSSSSVARGSRVPSASRASQLHMQPPTQAAARLPTHSHGGIGAGELLSGVLIGAGGVGGPATGTEGGAVEEIDAAAQVAADQLAAANAALAAAAAAARAGQRKRSTVSAVGSAHGGPGGRFRLPAVGRGLQAAGGSALPSPSAAATDGARSALVSRDGSIASAALTSLCGSPLSPERGAAGQLPAWPDEEQEYEAGSDLGSDEGSEASGDHLPELGVEGDMDGEHLTRKERQDIAAALAAEDWESRLPEEEAAEAGEEEDAATAAAEAGTPAVAAPAPAAAPAEAEVEAEAEAADAEADE